MEVIMDKKENKTQNGNQQYVAYFVLGFSAVVLVALGITAIVIQPDEAINIFNVILPVVASWVGTVLAFYFGRENFVAANEQVRELVQRLSPEQLAKSPVTSLMRSFSETRNLQIPEGKTDKDIKVSELLGKFDGKLVTRLPVVNTNNSPRYMIHESKVNKYLAGDGKQDDALEAFIAAQKKDGVEFGINKGFVVVSEETTITEAKRKMEETPNCQDIFITKKGTPDEPLTGWISNMRLGKYLEA
jgi:CBS domain-containing protein